SPIGLKDNAYPTPPANCGGSPHLTWRSEPLIVGDGSGTRPMQPPSALLDRYRHWQSGSDCPWPHRPPTQRVHVGQGCQFSSPIWLTFNGYLCPPIERLWRTVTHGLPLWPDPFGRPP